jgi:hypothetical protein
MCGLFIALRKAAKAWQVGFAAVALFGGLFAQAAAADGPTPLPGTTTWGGLGWGLGIAADFDVRGNRVVGADVVTANNIVRVNDSSNNVSVGFVLEAHYFLRDFVLPKRYCGPSIGCSELAHGPFIGIEVGNGTSATPDAKGPITGYALGWMVGLRHLPTDPTAKPSTSSWNFGVGLRIDPTAKVLGDGIVANQPLPAGETVIRYKTEPRVGIMLLSSFSF